MDIIAIIGSGPLGGSVAHALARRNRVAEVRLIDEGTIARGKALDILQSAAVERFGTRVTSSDAIEAAVGAAVIVLADAAATQAEHAGEAGLALVRRLVRAGTTSPILGAGASQRELIGRAVSELRLPATRLVGSAPFALESALRALVGLGLNGSGVDVSLRVLGVPPTAAVVAWEEAGIHGQPVSAEMPAHVIAGLSARIPGLWPPGPYALGAAAGRVAEALAHGSRRRFTCFVTMDTGAARGAVVAMPVEIRSGGVHRVVEPALTRQERTALENAIESGYPSSER